MLTPGTLGVLSQVAHPFLPHAFYVEGVGRPPPPHDDPSYRPTSNYRVPPAHRFHKYKLRLLYFRMQKLTPYSIKFIKRNSGGACPQTLLGRHCADDALHPPPPPKPINDPPPPPVNPGYGPAIRHTIGCPRLYSP